MTIFNVLDFIGGLCLFLFSMNYMSSALEKKAGSSLSGLLSKFTSNKYIGFLLGLFVTAVIQSSSATAVMVVGFVNSGIMTLSQSVGVIIGANVGTTVTAWIFSLTGISGDSLFVNLLKPSSFAPVVALVGVVMFMFSKKSGRRDTGMIFLGFAFLLFGLDRVTDSVSGLADVPEFTKLFVLFKNPVLGIIVGAVLSGVIQSSSAAVGILQALSQTGSVSVAAALPIILGQNIGTTLTAMISSVGANKNARRAAAIHLNFNLLGTLLVCLVYYVPHFFVDYSFENAPATPLSIALIHTLCNLAATLVFLPGSAILEKITKLTIKENEKQKEAPLLDERFFVNPSLAVSQSRNAVIKMAHEALSAFDSSLKLLKSYDSSVAEEIKEKEKRLDLFEDAVGSYLIKLNSKELSQPDSREAALLLKLTGEFERISDHAVHISNCGEKLASKKIGFSKTATEELSAVSKAVFEILDITVAAFCRRDNELALNVEPLEQVIDKLTSRAEKNSASRVFKNECGSDAALVFADVISVLESVADHCSKIAASSIEASDGRLDVHEYLHSLKKNDEEFSKKYALYEEKYLTLFGENSLAKEKTKEKNA